MISNNNVWYKKLGTIFVVANNFLWNQWTLAKNKFYTFYFRFLTWTKEKAIFFTISSFFAFKQTKETILLLVLPLQILNLKKILLMHFRVTDKFSEALRLAKKLHFKVKFWNGGSLTIWHNMKCIQIFFSKITSPYSHSRFCQV